jgi:hypothetical protein
MRMNLLSVFFSTTYYQLYSDYILVITVIFLPSSLVAIEFHS